MGISVAHFILLTLDAEQRYKECAHKCEAVCDKADNSSLVYLYYANKSMVNLPIKRNGYVSSMFVLLKKGGRLTESLNNTQLVN